MLSEKTSYDQNYEEKKEIEISPISKWKRIALFLADFFINAIIAFTLFNLAVAPIAKLTINYDSKNQQYIQCQKDRVDVFIYNDVLKTKYNEGESDRYVFSNNLTETYDYWLSYYVLTDNNPDIIKHPLWGHKENNETIRHFYNDIRSNINGYIEKFDSYNSISNYFVKNGTYYSLNESTKALLYPHFDPANNYQLLQEGQTIFDNINKNIFNPFYSSIIDDANHNNLTYDIPGGRSLNYLDCKTFMDDFDFEHSMMLMTSSLISYFITFIVYYIMIPLIRKDRKTIGMMILHDQMVNINSLNFVKRKQYPLIIFYNLFSTMGTMLFLPLLLIGFNQLFALPALPVFALISLLYIFVSLLMIITSSMNRGLSDVLGQTVMITDDNLDIIYRERGYYI